jgi:hypothetical protein
VEDLKESQRFVSILHTRCSENSFSTTSQLAADSNLVIYALV